ncbi:hypothetical protein [Rubritalea tangerina]
MLRKVISVFQVLIRAIVNGDAAAAVAAEAKLFVDTGLTNGSTFWMR